MLLKIVLYLIIFTVILAMLAPYILEKLRQPSRIRKSSNGVADLSMAFRNDEIRDKFASHYKKSLAEGGGIIKVHETQRPGQSERSKVRETLFPGVKLGQLDKINATMQPNAALHRETMSPQSSSPAANVVSAPVNTAKPAGKLATPVVAVARPVARLTPATGQPSVNEAAQPNTNPSFGIGYGNIADGNQQRIAPRISQEAQSQVSNIGVENQEVGKTHPPKPWIPKDASDENLLRPGVNAAPTMSLSSHPTSNESIAVAETNLDSNLSPQQREAILNTANRNSNEGDTVNTDGMAVMEAPKLLPRQDDIKTQPLQSPDDLINVEAQANHAFSTFLQGNQEAARIVQSSQGSKLAIRRIWTPIVVEQGDRDQAITIALFNNSPTPVTIAQATLRFYQDSKDVSSEYQIRAKVGNPNFIAAGGSEEIRLSVDIAETATLGKILLVPVIMSISEGTLPQAAEINTTRMLQWRVEPNSRIFRITTEHQGMETAGVPFQITLETFLNNEPEINYQGPHRVYFNMNNMANDTAAKVPQYLDLTFKDGKVITDRCFCFYNTVETYILSAQDNKTGGPEGSSDNIIVTPGTLGSFRLEISSPQKNNVALDGINTLTALDIYSNVKTDYHSDTVLSCSEGSIKGLPANAIPATAFQQGSANLTALNFRICVPEFHEEGKVVRLTARGNGKSGSSEGITIIPAAEMSVSATQAMIRRLWGYRRRHIWIANTDAKVTKELENAFQNDYEVLIHNLNISQLDAIISSPPDVLFLDVESSGEDGYQLMRELRKFPNMECLPIFMIGPATEAESKISEVLRSGGVYLAKPLSMPTLRAMVADLLQNLSVEQGHMPTRGTRLPGSEGLIYQIVAKVGEGGMGYIYEARRLRDQKKVIIKYLPPRDYKNIKSVIRFIQEAHTVLAFHHENLVSGYDMIMDRNRCFYVMEFIEGKTVEQLIRQENKMKPERAVRIVLQVARGLQCLQEDHDLVHRDIKPSNILVMDNGLVKLVDFGIAKISNHHLTTVGIILGTPYYLSPEQILGKEVTIQSDIYSLGATFYHMVTGEHPFQGADVYAIIHQRLNRDPRDPRQYNASLPRAVAQIILRMMDQKPSKRYEAPKDLITDLDNVLRALDSGMLPMEADRPLNTEQASEQNGNAPFSSGAVGQSPSNQPPSGQGIHGPTMM